MKYYPTKTFEIQFFFDVFEYFDKDEGFSMALYDNLEVFVCFMFGKAITIVYLTLLFVFYTLIFGDIC